MKMMTLALLVAAMPLAWADDDGDRQEAVYDAACAGEAELSKALATGVSINVADADGETALMEAAAANELNAVRLLIKHGADVNVADEDGETALMMAAEDGSTQVVRELIKAGAKLDMRDGDGETALMKAKEDDHTECVRVLSEAGAQ